MGISSHPDLLQHSIDLMPVFKCLGDETRAQILVALSDEGELNVNQITERVDISRSAVSHHLAQLKQAKLVQVRRVGNERYYSILFLSILHDIQNWVDEFQDQCKHLQ